MSGKRNSTLKDSARADALTGQRNENSVLFSLGNLAAMASAQRPASAGPMHAAPSTRAPASEGSGLIDIRAMRALMDNAPTAGAAPRAPDTQADLLPSFGDGGFAALSVEPLVSAAPAPAAAAKPKPRSSSTPLYIVVALLGLGLLGLGALIVLDEPSEVQVTREVITVPPTVEDDDGGAQTEQDPDPADGHANASEASAEPTDAPAEADADANESSPTRRGKTSNTKANKSNGNNGNKGTKSTSSATASSAASSDDPGNIDVDCLLNKDLDKCKKRGTKAGTETKSEGETKASAPELTKKLDQSQILDGIRPVKTAAKSCGSGTTVAIKFSVEGSTGRVISAKALDEHASSSVGKCVASSAKRAVFPKFQAQQQGFTFKFRL